MGSLAFPFAVSNKDLALSKDIKLDSIKSVVLTYKYERIRQPAYGNERIIFRTFASEGATSYIQAIEEEIKNRTLDPTIQVNGKLNEDGLLELAIYFDERIYYALV